MTKHVFSGLIDSRHRRGIHAIITKVMAKSEKYIFTLMPIVDVAAMILEHEIVDDFGGMTNERSFNEEGKAIASISTEVGTFKPGSYQENIPFNEKDLLMLRKVGTVGDRGITNLTDGELSQLSLTAKKLSVRLDNRLQFIGWKALIDGTYEWLGKVKNFGIPVTNTLSPAIAWDQPSADPVFDLLGWLNEYDGLRKYKIKEMVMNKSTASKTRKAILELNRNDQGNANIRTASLDDLLAYYAPELPAVKICEDTYQEETVVNGKVTASAAKTFLANGIILLIPDFEGTEFPAFGQIQITENMNGPEATLDRPAQGVYTFIDEKGLENKSNPHIKMISGFNGGANLMRPFDVWKFDVLS